MNRIDRLSAILTMLQSYTMVKPKQITERFGIGIRTVYRDIRALEEAGIPISGDSKAGYSLVEGYKLPPLMFTQEEAFAFLAAEKLVDNFTDSGIRASYKSGVDKIRAVMNVSEKDIIIDMNKNIGIFDSHPPTTADAYNYLHILMNSIAACNKVELTYHAYSSNETTIRMVEPVGIFFSMSNWYLVAFCNYREEYRTFRISRIKDIKQTDLPIDKKHPPLDSFLKSLEEETELMEVIVEVNKADLPIIDDSKYYQGLVLEKAHKDGDVVELHFMVFSPERFARWYLSYMDIAKIKSPEQLSQIVNEILNKKKV
ncbi:YafY family protein [Dysgonomonas sp. 25]|uniref:helix-turn-helix transcriptional regulator n=1 Tax=Dysgonomonas sp. 25 TaxID=2302933 RepID=UPI0013D49B25|nr:YafY family protein [Dysgonomonas sp. 25]NDV67429.1 YafY family transcriptional regulator [Dysgonomonas sp. 25]